MLQGVPDLSDFGDVYELGFGLGPDKPPTSAIIRKEFQQRILYQLSPLEVTKNDSVMIKLQLRTRSFCNAKSYMKFSISFLRNPYKIAY